MNHCHHWDKLTKISFRLIQILRTSLEEKRKDNCYLVIIQLRKVISNNKNNDVKFFCSVVHGSEVLGDPEKWARNYAWEGCGYPTYIEKL